VESKVLFEPKKTAVWSSSEEEKELKVEKAEYRSFNKAK